MTIAFVSSARNRFHRRKEILMSQATSSETTDDLRPEYDLATLLEGAARGKYAASFHEGSNLVLLDPELARAFPSDEAVNRALRLVLEISQIPQTKSSVVPKV
jgi:hypothetical protein